jgi:hypothetical protein
MTDAKRLIEQATPLPWKWETNIGWGPADSADARLIEYAVNRLPDYDALREVTEGLTLATDPRVRAYLTDKALDILRRLREGVSA